MTSYTLPPVAKRGKMYLSGPMTHYPDNNFPLFNSEAARLRALGYDIENPAENEVNGEDWVACMRADIVQLMKCDAIALLPGWQKSRGAHLEWTIGLALGFKLCEAASITEKA